MESAANSTSFSLAYVSVAVHTHATRKMTRRQAEVKARGMVRDVVV